MAAEALAEALRLEQALRAIKRVLARKRRHLGDMQDIDRLVNEALAPRPAVKIASLANSEDTP